MNQRFEGLAADLGVAVSVDGRKLRECGRVFTGQLKLGGTAANGAATASIDARSASGTLKTGVMSLNTTPGFG